MFENSLYTIVNLGLEANKIKCQIQLNPLHEIFKGHFPENPILPGVCTLQIIKEVCEKALQKSLILKKGDNLKFTSLIVPDAKRILTIEVNILAQTLELLNISVQLTCENESLFKMKASYQCLP